ncbi:uncharacterized protein LOC122498448 [Leptopilina heterotoma]|uniref:uncharacterized protein LOC122498448 n=1 Tax=Leptopilina heterotoma TaxID=63436 RepID=UPI001CA803DC|nr:uncharacterized protein LOC122498448 [Leptopilina heterotoma]
MFWTFFRIWLQTKKFLMNRDITGVDEELIRSFATILKTISSGFSINIDAFEKYCSKTAELYVKKYKWYHMPQSIHKLLIHGPRIIKEAVNIIKTLGNITPENFPEVIQ